MGLETAKTLLEYLQLVGYNGPLFNGSSDLSVVQLKNDCYCWRYKNKFLFFDLSELNDMGIGVNVKKLRQDLILKFKGDKNILSTIGLFINYTSPSQETISVLMSKLSPIYKVTMASQPNTTSVVTLKGHCTNFMNSLPHIYKTFLTDVYIDNGITFFDVPGIRFLISVYVNTFYKKINLILSQVGDEFSVLNEYAQIAANGDIKSKPFPLSAFRRACSSTVPNVIKKSGQMNSIVFSTCYNALVVLMDTCINKLSTTDYNFVRNILMASMDDVVVNIDTHAPNSKFSPIKQRRPEIKILPKKTWRDKRPPPINTKLEVNMSRCVHADTNKRKRNRIFQPRKSVRIAKLNPRRSIRLKTR